MLGHAGKFDQRVSIQAPPAPESPANSFNEPSGAWTTLFTRWAAIEPLSGREAYLAAQQQSNVTHKVTLRYVPVSPLYRVVFGSRIFYIESVLREPGDRPIYTVLSVREDTKISLRTLTITPGTLTDGTLGVAYSQQLTAVGAVGTVTFVLASGSLPPGVTLSATGLLAGTPS